MRQMNEHVLSRGPEVRCSIFSTVYLLELLLFICGLSDGYARKTRFDAQTDGQAGTKRGGLKTIYARILDRG